MAGSIEEEIARLREELASANRVREALLAGIAHDLRNPLNTFAMSTGLLREDLESGDVDVTRALSLLTRMERATQRQRQLIDDLVEASHIEAGKIELAARPESAELVLHQAVEATRAAAAERSTAIEAAEVDASLVIMVDRARTVEALGKAVAFVLKSVGDGGRITLGAERSADHVEIGIRGANAGGVPSSTPAIEEGRGGLALLIARGLVSAQGGRLDVLDGGMRVAITLPST